jgi:hypothetical protein
VRKIQLLLTHSFLLPPYIAMIYSIFFVYPFFIIYLFLFTCCYLSTFMPCFCLKIYYFILCTRSSIYFLHLCFIYSYDHRLIYFAIYSSCSTIFFHKLSEISSSRLPLGNLLSRTVILVHTSLIYFSNYYLLLYFYGDKLADFNNFLSILTVDDCSFLIGL